MIMYFFTFFKKMFMFFSGILLLVSIIGAESCENVKEQEQANSLNYKRELKKRIEVNKIEVPQIKFENGQSYDMSEIINIQLTKTLLDSGNFIVPFENEKYTIDFLSRLNLPLDDSKLMIKRSKLKFSSESSCLLLKPQVGIGGSVYNFEIVNDLGVRFGFNTNVTSLLNQPVQPKKQDIPQNNKVSLGGLMNFFPTTAIKMKSFAFNMILQAYEPGKKNSLLIGAAQGSASKNKLDMKMELDLYSLFNMGADYFYETPINKYISKAISKAVNELNFQLNSIPWNSKVIDTIEKNGEEFVIILGGLYSGLKLGDKFKIFNELHLWEDQPCKSSYLGSVSDDQEEAIIEITSLGDDLSFAKILEKSGDPIEIGAKVVIYELKKEINPTEESNLLNDHNEDDSSINDEITF